MPSKLPLLLLASAPLISTPWLCGQTISLIQPDVAYTQNFNTLSSTAGSTTNNLPLTGWSLFETGGSLRNNGQYAVDTGGSTTGDVFSYGSSANSDRALGGLRTGTLIPLFGAGFTNNTGSTITSLAISYTGEQWRLGVLSRTDRLDFQYSTDATSISSGTWTDVDALDFTTPNTTATGAKDGNSAANRSLLSSSISSLSISAGASVWIRWQDIDATGAEDGLAVDDFSLTATAVPEPASAVAFAGLLAFGFAFSRRRGHAIARR
jgi:hypothetical protein